MFIQMGNDVVNSDWITAIRFKPEVPWVKVWLAAPIGPRFFWWTGLDYERFRRWLYFLNDPNHPQVVAPREE